MQHGVCQTRTAVTFLTQAVLSCGKRRAAFPYVKTPTLSQVKTKDPTLGGARYTFPCIPVPLKSCVTSGGLDL